jgi:hypothetical protein
LVHGRYDDILRSLLPSSMFYIVYISGWIL